MKEKARKLREAPAETQRTKPKKGKPVEIPVPHRKDVERDLLKIAKAGPKND